MQIKIIGPKDPALEVTQNMLRDNHKLNAEIDIIPWAEYRDVLMDSLTAKSTPNQLVFVPGHVWIPELAHAGYLAPLNPLIDKLADGIWEAYQYEDVVENVKLESKYQNNKYTIPTFNDGQILFYRSDLVDLEETEPSPDISPFDLLEIIKSIDLSPDVFGIALKAHPSEILFDWMPFFLSAGGILHDESLQPTFASDAGVRALEAYCELRKFTPPYTHEYGNEEIAQVLKEGKAAIVTTWGGQAAPIFLDQNNSFRDQYKTAVFPYPCGATWGMAIPTNQPEKEQIEALKMALALNGKQQDLEVILKAGSPIRKSSYSEKAFSEFSWLKAQYKMLQRCSFLPMYPEFGNYLGPMTEAIYKTFMGEAKPHEALIEAENTIKNILTT